MSGYDKPRQEMTYVRMYRKSSGVSPIDTDELRADLTSRINQLRKSLPILPWLQWQIEALEKARAAVEDFADWLQVTHFLCCDECLVESAKGYAAGKDPTTFAMDWKDEQELGEQAELDAQEERAAEWRNQEDAA